VAHRTDWSSAYFLLLSAHQLLAWLAGRTAHRLTSSFLLPVSGVHAREMDRSSAYFLVPSAHQWIAWLAGRSAHRLTSLFLPLISGFPDGLPDGSLIGLLPCSFRSSVARRTDRTSAYILVPSAHQWLARPLAGQIALRLTSSFLPLVSGLTNGLPGISLFGFLPLINDLPDGSLVG